MTDFRNKLLSASAIIPFAGGVFLTTGVPVLAQEKPVLTASVEEIIVTAQKRAERLQDVPISISVLGGADLDKSTGQGLSDTLNRVPGVALTTSALGNPQVAVRGVTSGALLGAGASTVAYYLDSVPFGFTRSALVPDADVYDLERIEVLRGPQGTLYGASALNGVVRILTSEPDLSAFQFKARGSVSSTENGGENYRGDMAFNVPIMPDKLAARVVAGYQDLSGWIDKPGRKDANDGQRKNLRMKLKAQPTDAFSAVASVWLSRSSFSSQSIGRDDGTNSVPTNDPFTANYNAYGLKLGYDFSSFSLSSMTSYVDYKIAAQLSFIPIGLSTTQFANYDSSVFSQELLLNSTHEGPWRWTLGGMYRDGADRRARRFNPVASLLPFDYADLSKSIATFGEITRSFLDGKLEMTGGLRYFHDDVTNKENISFTGNPATPLIRSKAKFDAVTPRAVVTWHASEQSTIYASYSQGFRSGLTQLPEVVAQSVTRPLDADRLTNYELGAKGTLWDGRVDVDTAVYYMKWKDVQQVLGISQLNNNAPPYSNALVNAPSASGTGVDFALTIHPLDGMDVGANISWNNLSFDSNVISRGAVLFNKGERPAQSPEYTVGAFANYSFPLGENGLTGTLAASVNYISNQDNRAVSGTGHINYPGDNMTIARTSFSVDTPEHWSATLYIDNLNNETGSPIRPGGVPDWSARVRPRTFGLQIEYKY